ncbi:MAG TPA: flagellar hook-associated protein FlgL [Pilimelia sp.]|nr:flagellar hook-associated protein FlgL [Pilimelia sp.]
MAIQVRVTQQSIAARVTASLQNNLNRMGDLQERLSSGKMITRPSDSPTGTVSSLQLRSEIRAVAQYSRNADDGLGWLSTLDNTLTSSVAQVRRVQELTLRGKNAGASSPESRAALATEVENIREELIGLANTRYLDRPVFGGTTSGAAAYDSNGVFRPGPTGSVSRTIGDGTKVRVDLAGPEAFGTGATDLFAVLDSIAGSLRTNPTALAGDLNNLNTALENLQTKLADVGSRYNRVEQMRQTADDRALTLRGQLSEVEDIDLPQTIMEVQLQQTAYQAALATTAKVIQPSLIDFLR